MTVVAKGDLGSDISTASVCAWAARPHRNEHAASGRSTSVRSLTQTSALLCVGQHSYSIRGGAYEQGHKTKPIINYLLVVCPSLSPGTKLEVEGKHVA